MSERHSPENGSPCAGCGEVLPMPPPTAGSVYMHRDCWEASRPLRDAIQEAALNLTLDIPPVVQTPENDAGLTMTSEQWISALADAFDLGKWAAYTEERDGGDGSEVHNPYRVIPPGETQ